MPTVDVAIPCYRYGHMLPDAVASVLDQEGVEVRVLIIDDASDDGSGEVARELAASDPRVQARVHEVNQGHIATFTEGVLDWPEGDYNLLLSADDLVAPGALARAAAVMDANPEVGLVYGDYALVHGEQSVRDQLAAATHTGPARAVVARGHDWLRRRFAEGTNVVPSPTAVTRTSVQKQVGGYNPRLSHTSDLEMWMRFALRSDVARVEAKQALFRLHSANMSTSFEEGARLADISQRLLAFQQLLARAEGILPDLAELDHQMRRSLARDAVRQARRADSPAAAQALVDFATGLNGALTRLPEWYVLKARELVGPRVFAAARDLAGAARRAAGRSGDAA